MSGLLAFATRYSPLLLLAFLLVAVIQLGLQLGVTRDKIDGALAGAGWYFAAGAVFFGALSLAGVLYDRGKLPRLSSARWIMDILDRLTNKQALERLMSGEEESVVIDADDLARRLKSKVVGQDAV